MECFSSFGMPWPPDVNNPPPHLMEVLSTCPRIMQELIFFLDAKWPMLDAKCGDCDLVDRNPSMQRLIGDGASSPWHRNVMPTILTTTRALARTLVEEGKPPVYSFLHGLALMAMMGVGPQRLRP